MSKLADECRQACRKLRRTPMPIADVIPLLQRAAAALDAADVVIAELRPTTPIQEKP